MEFDAEKLREDQQKPVANSLAFCWDELVSNLMRSLQDLASYKGVPPEVCLRLGDEEMMIHGVLLAALSSWWRKRLDPLLQQDTLIIHNITVDIQLTHGVLYATRSLLYSGSMTVSSSLLEQVQSVTRSLNLDNHELSYSVCSNGMYLVQWTGFEEHLLRALQYMCCNQQCTDVAVVVNGHIIKAHKLILGASSPILNSAFQEDRRIRIIHLPDIKVKIAQSLITYMYFGKTCVQKDMLVDFHKLCGAFQVESLQELTKRFAAKVTGSSDKKPKSHVTIHARVRPEAKDLWGRLQQYYTVGRNADLMLVVEDKRMLAHKTLFSAICPPIHELLVQELSNEHALVMITSMNHSLWEGILNIMYRGSCTIVGTAISTVFSYIDLSLFDIEVNEVKPAQNCLQEDKNNQNPTLINQRLSFLKQSLGVPSFKNNRKLNVKKRKSLSQSEKVRDEASSSKQIQNGKRIRSQNASLEDQDSIHNMIEDIKLLNDAATCSKEILMSTEPEPKTCKEKGNPLPSSTTESSFLEQNASWEGEEEKLQGTVSDEIFPKFRRDKSYSCMECGATFPSLLTLTVHSQSSHTTEATLETCEHCGKSFIQIKEIREHKNTNLGNQPMSCEQCAKSIIQGGLMHQHYKTNEEEKQVEVHERSLGCPHCSEIFSSQKSSGRPH
ncbi:uncharacterized protein LOC125036262 [Penaeus chinensis]|uniref:uncharacterized protein LOC125036262 n=1 Tax=Penaeus chinensis TaxID=139456 RepID=UPI001FB5F999|nr:uncharacterized protein LOC125036262 [Penaeus chinensis]XP_047484700.1 uncharacterized protein LOC125036262 [Penaeus chinensis]XP_047484701.1 uncharacterized protein LOC125036262 [Penaeus chinensis]XP_047484702.1 uncharacterized protein LOC125036262 [Penaeus chinensis]